jgi:hypothetical protein
VLRSAGEAFGRAASMVLNLINPSHLVLYASEGLLDDESPFMQEVNGALHKYSFSTTSQCEVVSRAWREESAAVGAAVGALLAKG